MELIEGLSFQQERIVSENHTAECLGSGSLSVFATPAMIAFMENTSLKAVASCLHETDTTVGAEINVRHLLASVVGEKLRCKAKVVKVDGRKVVFDISVLNERQDVVGTASHTRFVVDKNRFMENLKH